MFKVVKVTNVCYSDFNKNLVIKYKDEDGIFKYAACTENLTVEVGDLVEVYRDDNVNYKGIGAMALKVVSQKQKDLITCKTRITDLIRKYKRQLQTYQMRESQLADKREKLSVRGFWKLGYYSGRSELYKNIIDDLENLVDDQESKIG